MLPLLDRALSDARTLAHRILEFDDRGGSAAEASYGLPSAEQQDREARNWMLLGTNQRKPTNEVPMDAQQPDQSIPKAITDQDQNRLRGQQGRQRGLGSTASEQDIKDTLPSTGMALRSNPYQPEPGTPSTNPYSPQARAGTVFSNAYPHSATLSNSYKPEDQKKLGNAMATAAHAIREAARALAESAAGKGYEPEPPYFELDSQRAKASPGTLLICQERGWIQSEQEGSPTSQTAQDGTQHAKPGTAINSSSIRGPGVRGRPAAVLPAGYPMVPQFYPEQRRDEHDSAARTERSRSPRAQGAAQPSSSLTDAQNACMGGGTKQHAQMGGSPSQGQQGKAKAPYATFFY